ncbi:MAG: TonB-dependent receptor [Burkholderiales bacterium]|nr:TonB-dependent receptor [Burkholderiales bacterium]MDE2503082.1 TonB-dependent receptor [Burkholderiales bacterium]
MKYKLTACAAALVTLASGLPCLAAAATPPITSAPGAGNDAFGASSVEVIVIARKKRHAQGFRSGQSTKTMDQDQIRAAGAVGGVAHALTLIPGVSAASYGNTGSQKTTFSINGIKAGWGNFTASLDNGSLGVSFDGVPMNNPGNGLWQATLIPQSAVLQTMGVTYGPGDPQDRWYTNIGGALTFTPLQPNARAGGEAALTVGSYGAKNVYVSLQTGRHDGWETVLFAGGNKSGSFLRGPDGFDQPSRNNALYVKSRKQFGDGDISFAGYAGYSGAYRPLPVPVTPIPGVGVNGYDAGGNNLGGIPFSQQTSGFYTTLARNVNWKWDTNQIQMLWSQVNLSLSDTSRLHNLVYFTHEERLHYTTLHDYVWSTADPGKNETNNPNSYVLGDKLWNEMDVGHHHVSFGGYGQHATYHSMEQIYSSLPGIGPNNPDGNYDSDLWNQWDLALFAQDTWSPTSALHVTPGIRLVNYLIDFTPNGASQFPNATGTDLSVYATNGLPAQAAQKTFTKFEPGISMNWQALPWLAPFASYEVTYRQPENGGGVGPYVTLPPSMVNLEKGQHYQAGVKMHWDQAGSMSDVSATIAYSHLLFSNELLSTALPSGGGLLALGRSSYDALNIYADAEVQRDLYAFVNFGLVHAKFLDYSNSNGSFHGVKVANTPDYNVNLGVYDILHLGAGQLLKPRLTYVYTGSQYMFDNGNNITSDQKIPAFGLFNASVEWDLPLAGQRVKATVEVDNLLNHQYNAFEYISSGGTYAAGAGTALALPGAPRTVYLTLGASF